jgi:hypothetical protein
MAAIDPAQFAEECAIQGIRFGVNPHYLMAVAALRSGLNDDTQDGRIGPFRLTQEEWDPVCTDPETGLNLRKNDIGAWDMQPAAYALMTRRAQNRLAERLARNPSAVELYREQWPNDPVRLPEDLLKKLEETAEPIAAALSDVLGEPAEPAQVIENPQAETPPTPKAPANAPTAGPAFALFVSKAPGIMRKLMAEFGLNKTGAAGILGNLGHECGGFRIMQEQRPLAGRGGWGWAQWTGPRRRNFEAFCQQNGLGLASDEANYGFLKHELSGEFAVAIREVKNSPTLAEAVRAFERTFEKAHPNFKHFESRDRYARIAFDAFG